MKHPFEARPGRDRHAVHHRAQPGQLKADTPRNVVVVGGGIAGISAAVVLAEHGIHVTLLEATPRLGGRVAAWEADDERSMSRGFHAFFRQYYNLRALLRRIDPDLSLLTPIADYPLQRPDGMTDSFTHISRTPPWSILSFVKQSPSFTLRSLANVNVKAALELVQTRFPDTFIEHENESAAQFLDRLNFPPDARGLALEVFSRSFFSDPAELSAGELVAMFHMYFLGSAEGLLFDVPIDDYDHTLWQPLGRYLESLGVDVQTSTSAVSMDAPADRVSVKVHPGSEAAGADAELGTSTKKAKSASVTKTITADAAVIALDPRSARAFIANTSGETPSSVQAAQWRRAVATSRNAPPFVVVRLWLDGFVRDDRPAFVGTSGFRALDNISVLERFEHGAKHWSQRHKGSVIELHAYAADAEVLTDASAADALTVQMMDDLHDVFPETQSLPVRHTETLIRDDCALIAPGIWRDRPGTTTPWSNVVLAGDWVRCRYPVALMERAATTGFLAADHLLANWGIQGQDLWTVPMTGLLSRARD